MAIFGLPGATLGLLGVSWGAAGGSMGYFLASWGPTGCSLGSKGHHEQTEWYGMEPCSTIGGLWVPSWGILGPMWGRLGHFGCFGAIKTNHPLPSPVLSNICHHGSFCPSQCLSLKVPRGESGNAQFCAIVVSLKRNARFFQNFAFRLSETTISKADFPILPLFGVMPPPMISQ